MFTGTPTQVAKALVMGALLGESFAKWGKVDMLTVDTASRLADVILTAAEGAAPSLPSAALMQAAAPAPVGGMRHGFGGGISLPSMPSPQGSVTAQGIPAPPGAMPSPPIQMSDLPYSGQVAKGAGAPGDNGEGVPVLDLSQSR